MLIQYFLSFFNSNQLVKILFCIGIVYALFAPIEIMDIDAAQYASISREMNETGNYLQVFQRGQDYLDKPPLLFWLVSASFSLFGVSTIAFKLPAICILILALYSTYRAAKLFYSHSIALTAMLILASTQAFLLMVNDVRTDGILTGFTIFSVWQLLAFSINKKWINLLGASFGIALAMLSKGPIGAIIPLCAVGAHLLYSRNFKTLFHYKWLLLPCLVLAFLSPMLYGLYQQFDLHPEKEVYGLKGPSGIEFYFWTQSFGRITGDIYWKDDSSPLFFLTSLAWDAQPWYLLGLIAFIFSSIHILKNIKTPEKNTESWSYFGLLIPFVALSSSHFKLPHYVFPLLPYLAILISTFIHEKFQFLAKPFKKSIYIILCIPVFIFPILVSIISIYVFPSTWYKLMAYMLLFMGGIILTLNIKTSNILRIIYGNVFTSMWAGIFLATHFYPNLLEFQGTAKIGKWATENQIGKNDLYALDAHSFSLDFYGQRITPFTNYHSIDDLEKGKYICVLGTTYEQIKSEKPNQFKVIKAFPQYSVSKLKLEFLLANSREKTLEKVYILQKE